MALQGFDLSNWQADTAVDSAPNFVILKATEGTGHVDPSCDRKYQRAKSKGKLLGVYHFASMGDPTAEADYFVNNTTGYWQAKEAILVLDYETNTNVSWALTWLNRVEARTGVKPLIYMSASAITAVDWTPVKNQNYGLWVAGYPAKYNVTNPAWTDGSDMPYNIAPWDFAAIWQFTSSAGTLDRDVAFMTADAWKRYAGATAPAPKPDPVITTKDVTTTKAVPFDSTTVEDDTKEVGYSEITTVGVNGVETIVTRTTYSDGNPTGSQVVSDSVTTAPVTQVTTVGTKQPDPTPDPDPTPEPTPEPEKPTNWLAALVAAVTKFLTEFFGKFKK